MKRFRTSLVDFRLFSILEYTSGSLYIKAKSSNSLFIEYNPKRCASGAYKNFVSEAILSCLSARMLPRVRMLCSRSASLIKTTRISSEIVKIILRKFSAWIEAFSSNTSGIFVNPSIIRRTFDPKRSSTSSNVMCVSSTVSCNNAHVIAVAPNPISSTQIRATAIGW